MTPAEFAARAVGLPWVRWRSDWKSCDCFGLLILYWREVHGQDLGAVPHTDIATGFAAAAGWQRCEPEPGACAFMAYHRGAPAHCGVLITADTVLHSLGDEERGGSVRTTGLALMRRVYTDITFHRPATC